MARQSTTGSHVRTPDDHSAAPGWFFRQHPRGVTTRLSQPKRCQTALRGRPVANSMTADCHSTSKRRPRNLSVPPDRLLKTIARPPQGDRSTRELAEESRPPSSLRPGRAASAQLVVGSAGGPPQCSLVNRNRALAPVSGGGANPMATGSGTLPQPRPTTGSMPQVRKPEQAARPQTRSPSSPQFGYQLPPPARCLGSTRSCLSSPGVSLVFVFATHFTVTTRCHSDPLRRQELLAIERHLLPPQVVHRPADLRLQDGVRLLRPALLRLTLHPRLRRRERA